MEIIKSAILGLVQGLAEFLPISSSGHLNILEALFQMKAGLFFDVMLHLGTLFAVAVVFWKDWVEMIAHPIRNKTLALLIVASLPALVAKVLDSVVLDGLLFGSGANSVQTTNVLLGVCFLITGLLLLITQAISKRRAEKGIEVSKTVGYKNALAMGCMQAVGMLPGISRSGSTLFGGVASKLDREAAAKFSFMMSAPAILASALSEGKDILGDPAALSAINIPAMAVGIVVAAVSGYFAIRFFLKLISSVSLNWFALYVILIGILVLVLQAVGVMPGGSSDQAAQVAASAKAGLSLIL